MLRLLGAVLALVAFASFGLQAQAGESDATRGLAFVQTNCSECHTIRGQARSPNPDAPSFYKLANTRGVTATALVVALQTSHKKMPNFTLPANRRDDAIAYILSLKKQN